MANAGTSDEKHFSRIADALTLYVLRAPAVRLARAARAAGAAPETMIAANMLLAAIVFASFWRGLFWPGLVVSAGVMILSTAISIGEAQARRLGATADRAIPMFWWWAWAHGLATWGRHLDPVYAVMVLWIAIGGAIAIAAAEIVAVRRFGIPIDAWRPFDTKFRLVSAARNPNLVILALALLAGRPDSGLVLVASWTLISLIVIAVRFAQMTERHARGRPIKSWLRP